MKSLRHPPHKKANTHFPIALYHKVSLALYILQTALRIAVIMMYESQKQKFPFVLQFFLSALVPLVAVPQAFLEQIKSKTALQRLRESSPQNLRFFPSRVLSFSA